MKIRKIIALAAAMFVASQAGATTINGSGLQNGLNNNTYNGDFRDVNTGQAEADQVFQVIDGAGSIPSVILFEFAGFRNLNSFGIYDIYNADNRLEVYSGPDSAGFGSLRFDTLANGNLFTVDALNPFAAPQSAFFTTSAFGFYLDGPQGPFFSQAGRNGGYDQLVGFQGNGTEVVENGFGFGDLLTADEYILAFEDLRLPGGDRDYSDFVVRVRNVQGIPAPAPLALLGLGLIGLGFARKRA
ncbi:MAG: DUF4114 domain-containing protein [Pseudomonadota bacterium]